MFAAGPQNYPDGPDKVAGFVDWHLIQAAQLDRIYTAGYFLGMLGLLAASLAACTATRQWPAVRVARRCAQMSRASTAGMRDCMGVLSTVFQACLTQVSTWVQRTVFVIACAGMQAQQVT